MRTSKRFTSLAAVAALGLLAVACGSDSKSATTTAPASAGATTPGTEATGTTPTGTEATADADRHRSNGNRRPWFQRRHRRRRLRHRWPRRRYVQRLRRYAVSQGRQRAGRQEDRARGSQGRGSPTNLQLLAQQKANPVIGVGFLFTTPMATVAASKPRHRRSASSTPPSTPAERLALPLRREPGLLPRRRRRRAEEQDRPHRLHRWSRDRPDQEVRGRLHRRCQGREPRHQDRQQVPRAEPPTSPASTTRPVARRSPRACTTPAPT